MHGLCMLRIGSSTEHPISLSVLYKESIRPDSPHCAAHQHMCHRYPSWLAINSFGTQLSFVSGSEEAFRTPPAQRSSFPCLHGWNLEALDYVPTDLPLSVLLPLPMDCLIACCQWAILMSISVTVAFPHSILFWKSKQKLAHFAGKTNHSLIQRTLTKHSHCCSCSKFF